MPAIGAKTDFDGTQTLFARFEDRHDVGVLERRGRFGLAAEALDEFGVAGEVGVKDLQGHAAGQVQVIGEPDVGHAAGADPPLDAVAAVNH